MTVDTIGVRTPKTDSQPNQSTKVTFTHEFEETGSQEVVIGNLGRGPDTTY